MDLHSPRREPKHDGAVLGGEEVREEEKAAEEDDEGAGARHPRHRGRPFCSCVIVSLNEGK